MYHMFVPWYTVNGEIVLFRFTRPVLGSPQHPRRSCNSRKFSLPRRFRRAEICSKLFRKYRPRGAFACVCTRVKIRVEKSRTNRRMSILQSDPSLASEENDRANLGFDRAASMNHPEPIHHQDTMQNRERSKLLLRKLNQNRERERGKERDQERERLHQLQSIGTLLLDLPPPPTHLSSYSQEASSSQSDKNVNNADSKMQ